MASTPRKGVMGSILSRFEFGRGHVLSESTVLNVSAVPPEPVQKSVVELSAELSRYGTSFEVDGAKRQAHMTLYMARFPNAHIKTVQKVVRELVPSLPRVQASHTGYFCTPGKYYELSYRRTDALFELHRSIMKALSRFRYSPGSPVIEDYFDPYSPSQQKNAKRWGYDLAEGLYRPHITITQFVDTPTIDLPKPPQDLSFEISRIGLFSSDRFGATENLLEEFSLA